MSSIKYRNAAPAKQVGGASATALTHKQMDDNFFALDVTEGTVSANQAIVVDSNLDFTGARNGTFTGTVTAAAVSGLSTPLGADVGGTGASSWTTGDIIYASGATTLSSLGIGTAGQILATNSTPDAPEWIDNERIITGICNTGVLSGVTAYTNIHGQTHNTTEANVAGPIPVACTAKKFYCNLSGNSNTTGDFIVTLMVNGSPSSITVTYGAGITGAQSDLVNTATITAGQKISIKLDNSGGDSIVGAVQWGFVLT